MAEMDSSDASFEEITRGVKKILRRSKSKKSKRKLQCHLKSLDQAIEKCCLVSGKPDDEVYSSKYGKMGKCLIFNHEKFDSGLKERPDSGKDATALKKFFDDLKFDVTIHTDKPKEEIINLIKEAGMKDHEDAYGFVCCVLSHGNFRKKEHEVISASDTYYSTDELFTPFEDCPSLAGKPKMFFIQACRGEKEDLGISVYFENWSLSSLFASSMNGTSLLAASASSIDGEAGNSSESTLCFKIPKKADFLIAYSSPKNCVAWKRRGEGSWFIQTLCSTLNERAEDLDLLSILTIVNNRVAYGFESSGDQRKQVPSVYSTLTKKINFFKSEDLSLSASDREESFEADSGRT